MANIAVLIGNGLSVALTHDLTLEKISRRFFSRLNYVKPADKLFIESLLLEENYKSDFEKCISSVEKYSDEMDDIEQLRILGKVNGLNLTEYAIQEKSIRESLYLFSALIVEIVNGNVKRHQIEAKLPYFVQWLTSIIDDQNEVDLFTLNYDLLLETILLETIGSEKFMEFYRRASIWDEIDAPRFYFNPKHAKLKKKDCKVRLYHLHGSISSFKDLKKESKNNRGVYFKITTEAIRENNFYEKIFDLNIVPWIITGGSKSDKIKESPFSFYYNEFMHKMSNEDQLCDKLVIIGYSFRDDHINSAIAKRLKLATQTTHPRQLKITIVDYADTDEKKTKFIECINTALGLEEGAIDMFIQNDSRIHFGGANSIDLIVPSKEAN